MASGQIEKVVLADSWYIIACRSVYLKIWSRDLPFCRAALGLTTTAQGKWFKLCWFAEQSSAPEARQEMAIALLVTLSLTHFALVLFVCFLPSVYLWGRRSNNVGAADHRERVSSTCTASLIPLSWQEQTLALFLKSSSSAGQCWQGGWWRLTTEKVCSVLTDGCRAAAAPHTPALGSGSAWWEEVEGPTGR